jgi:aminoglycoside phosphotransferase (APT) family kinase protein
MSLSRDWIMRATDDAACRECEFALAAPALPGPVMTPALAVSRHGDGHALLMRDISSDLIDPGQPITEQRLNAVLAAMAALHRTPPPSGISWCGLEPRLSLLTPSGARVAQRYGHPIGDTVLAGWTLFGRHATPGAVAFIHALFADLSPLLSALDQMPRAFLHGDMKLDNIGVDPLGRVWLIDWAMTLVAPAAIDFGWFLAINSRRLPVTLDEVMDRYAAAAALPAPERREHDAMTVICGLLLRGWRKALDAEDGQPQELRWWCDRVAGAASCLP